MESSSSVVICIFSCQLTVHQCPGVTSVSVICPCIYLCSSLPSTTTALWRTVRTSTRPGSWPFGRGTPSGCLAHRGETDSVRRRWVQSVFGILGYFWGGGEGAIISSLLWKAGQPPPPLKQHDLFWSAILVLFFICLHVFMLLHDLGLTVHYRDFDFLWLAGKANGTLYL